MFRGPRGAAATGSAEAGNRLIKPRKKHRTPTRCGCGRKKMSDLHRYCYICYLEQKPPPRTNPSVMDGGWKKPSTDR